MPRQKFEDKISKTVECLSDPKTYDVVCHEHRLGEPLPSIARLQKVIDMVREILFPGYFGNTSLRPNTTRHYMGVYVDELYELLSQEILAGMCFECHDDNAEKIEKHSLQAKEIAVNFIEELPEIRRKLVADVNA